MGDALPGATDAGPWTVGATGGDDGSAPMGLRIALLNPCFWPEVRRGSERVVRDLATGLLQRGHRPRLVTSHPAWPSRSVEGGLPIMRHWRPPLRALQVGLRHEYLAHVPFSYASLRVGSYHLAHAFYPTDALAAVRWAERTGRPAIFSVMGIPNPDIIVNSPVRRRVYAAAVRGSATVVALSYAAARSVHAVLGVEARVIYPGVDMRAFDRSGERAPVPTLYCPAAHDPRKRLDLLVEAFRLLRRERPKARLVLERPSSPEVAARLVKASPGVELVDDRPAVLSRRYSAAWITVLPARAEAFGLILLESLACGTPVVGRREGGVPEIVDSDAIGRLFEGDDPRELARVMLEALELCAEPAIEEACRARADHFRTERSVAAFDELYRRLLDGEPALRTA